MGDYNLFAEKILLQRIAEGDEIAFGQLYRLYVPRLASFLQGLTHSSEITNDLVQETFLQVWLHRDKLPAVEQPKAWIFRIAANITYNFLKRKVSERKAVDKISSATLPDQVLVDEGFYHRQLIETIKSAVDQLTPQRKKIYLLSRESGMTIPQIAKHIGLSESTVKNTLVTSLQQIRDYLKKRGFNISCLLILFWKF